MPDSNDYHKWLEYADSDFKYGSVNLEEHDEFFMQMCFNFQQAAEKYLKAYILKKNLKFRKIHDLTQLLEICLRSDLEFEDLREECVFLTDYYLESRYPVNWPISGLQEDAEKARESAREIGEFVKKKIR